jgi:hypothetical protein
MPLIPVVPMIIDGYKTSRTPPQRLPVRNKPIQNLSATQHIGNMSEFFKNPGKACGSCGKGRK